MKKLILTITCAAAASMVAIAEQAPATSGTSADGAKDHGKKHMDPAEVFKKLDANGDKNISLDEFKAGPMAKKDPVKAEEKFKKMDANGDGSISEQEYMNRPKQGGKKAEGAADKAQ